MFDQILRIQIIHAKSAPRPVAVNEGIAVVSIVRQQCASPTGRRTGIDFLNYGLLAETSSKYGHHADWLSNGKQDRIRIHPAAFDD